MDEELTEKRRNLRERTDRKWYTDDGDDEDVEQIRGFRLEDKIESDRFPTCNVREINGADLTLAFIQRNGFNAPLLVREKTGLGLRVPADDFTVKHVKMLVGSKRRLDVMDVGTQKNHEMTMRDWVRYYNDPDKDRLLNVISLEFSHTKLESYVQSPTVVRQIDWVDTVWPQHLKDAQIESTNAIDDMMYPKVQKYCLMSVKGCYTDFHIDFGGTSVWYHILRGAKIFWLIPPTERNISLYENWVLSGKQSDVFFGDTVDNCERLTLTAGNTFFIPSGWIHAVFTPQDSLVFGGNFLHSFATERQLQIAKVEKSTHVPQKFRYPFFTEMLWYVLAKYVFALLGHNHLEAPITMPVIPPDNPSYRIQLTQEELHGLKAIVMYLHGLQSHQKNVPELIRDPIALIKDVRTVVEHHRRDCTDEAATGRCVLTGICDDDVRPRRILTSQQAALLQANVNGHYNLNQGVGASKMPNFRPIIKGHGSPRRRRTRCKHCEACQRNDCGECSFCMDMVKFGGPGRAKQTCIVRQCLQPMLPVTASCVFCALDGWGEQPTLPVQKIPRGIPSGLMECSVCYEIAHPHCYLHGYSDFEGIYHDDLPNSWECPKCCKEGRNREYRPRHFRARQKSGDIRRISGGSETTGLDNDKIDLELDSDGEGYCRSTSPVLEGAKRFKMDAREDLEICDDSYSANLMNSSDDSNGDSDSRRYSNMHNAGGERILRLPMHVVRPAVSRNRYVECDGNPVYDREFMVTIFRYLTPKELVNCSLVCRLWARFTLHPSLWRRMDASHNRLSAMHLAGIVRRQPEVLILDWSQISKRQLAWLIARLPQLRGLSLQGIAWTTISALCTCVCPPLHTLDLSYSALNDLSLQELLSPPPDSRPGLSDTQTRLRHLRCFKIAGCDVTDVSVRYIILTLTKLTVLDLSSCSRITDAGVVQLVTPNAQTIVNLTSLNLANLKSISDLTLEHLVVCEALVHLNISHTPQLSDIAVARFLRRRGEDVEVIGRDFANFK